MQAEREKAGGLQAKPIDNEAWTMVMSVFPEKGGTLRLSGASGD